MPMADYGALTRRSDGSADPINFVDAHHVAPGTLSLALAGMTLRAIE